MLEVIATTLEEAKLIEKAGADRIELVSALSEGGLTPSFVLVESVLESVEIPVNVMIRPHSQSFVYSDDEITQMVEDINVIKALGANGVVLGVLDKDKKVDFHKLKALLDEVEDLEVTFHRAIDECENIIEEIELLADIPKIKRVLSSGGEGSAEDNIDTLKDMVKILGVNNKILLIGSGVNHKNIAEILRKTFASEIHVGRCVRNNNSCSERINEEKLVQLVNLYKLAKKTTKIAMTT